MKSCFTKFRPEQPRDDATREFNSNSMIDAGSSRGGEGSASRGVSHHSPSVLSTFCLPVCAPGIPEKSGGDGPEWGGWRRLEEGSAQRVLISAWHNASHLFVHLPERQSERLELIHATLNESEFAAKLRQQIAVQQRRPITVQRVTGQFCEPPPPRPSMTPQQLAFFVLSPEDELIYRAVALKPPPPPPTSPLLQSCCDANLEWEMEMHADADDRDCAISIMDCIIAASDNNEERERLKTGRCNEAAAQIRVRLVDFGNEMVVGLERTSLCIASSEAMLTTANQQVLREPGWAVRCGVIGAEQRARLRNTQRHRLDETCREMILRDHEALVMIVLRNRAENGGEQTILVDITGPSMGSLRHHVVAQQLESVPSPQKHENVIVQHREETQQQKWKGGAKQSVVRDEELERQLARICERLDVLEKRVMQRH